MTKNLGNFNIIPVIKIAVMKIYVFTTFLLFKLYEETIHMLYI